MSNIALVIVGALMLAAGLGLVYAGKVGLDSASHQLQEALTGTPETQYVLELVGGIALCVIGVACIVGGVSANRRTRLLGKS